MRPIVLLAFALLSLVGPTRMYAKEQVAPRVAANNSAGLAKLTGKQVVVYGKVNRAAVSKSGHHFLNFYSSNLSVVCFKSEVAQFDGGGPAKLWKNKQIEVSGKLELYRGKPQIKLTSPKQVRLPSESKRPTTEDDEDSTSKTNDSDATTKSDKGKFQLRQTDKFTWLSPAGLIYRGKDPKGLTRVEHVLRHAADQPRRQGSHGVFDGGKDQALATVDEAWKLARTKKIKPKQEGDRLAYTIPMGRRVGYLGGKTGAQRKHPPLKKVFIVIRGKSEVITAFPR